MTYFFSFHFGKVFVVVILLLLFGVFFGGFFYKQVFCSDKEIMFKEIFIGKNCQSIAASFFTAFILLDDFFIYRFIVFFNYIKGN